jgi:Domain of unknown function (DUF4149)
MSTVFRYLEFLSLGTWLGSIIFLSFVVAPGAFATLGSRDQAGAMVGMALGRLHWIGVAAGVVFLLARVAQEKSIAALFKPAAGLVVLMLALTLYSQLGVTARLAALRTEMVSVERTPETSPLRAEFDRLHRWSVRIEGTVLLCGLAALFLSVRENAR